MTKKMETKLKNILAIFFNVDVADIDENFSSNTVENWDSLKQMNLVVAIEEEFKIMLDEAESLLTDSYSSLYQLVSRKTNQGQLV